MCGGILYSRKPRRARPFTLQRTTRFRSFLFYTLSAPSSCKNPALQHCVLAWVPPRTQHNAPSHLASGAWAAADSCSRQAHNHVACANRARHAPTVQLGRAERDEGCRVWWDEVLLPIAAGRAWGRGLACRTFARSFTFSWSSQSGAELGRLPRSCERTLEWIIC